MALLLPAMLILSACREQILHDLPESEVNRLVARLSEMSIRAEKQKQADGKWALATDSSEVHKAMRFLSDARLMNSAATAKGEKTSMMTSREEQRFRFERALSREIEITLSNLPGILEARVHLNLPPVDPFFGRALDKIRGSASVLLVVSDLAVIREDVAKLVAGASGIDASEVAVMLSKTNASLRPESPFQAEPPQREEPDNHWFPAALAERKYLVVAFAVSAGCAALALGSWAMMNRKRRRESGSGV